ncbi:hypothetical protein KsCSTR_09810 [Candidatus Kuenenia stuttgartiensis]|uniref:Uncharacterized protein n=1 Tax=Kuenenia stuttgartiensis TaxID=174633 RepID=Q1PYW5_KUEST|nr:hypothetical protein KsCSTR_09810 [Candidatus Kuenenia stuttgartiensis]CAJ72277.1 unknown protein [Candidatus Kuenenia stuttgartiensis]
MHKFYKNQLNHGTQGSSINRKFKKCVYYSKTRRFWLQQLAGTLCRFTRYDLNPKS